MDKRLQIRIQRYGWDAAAKYYDNGWRAQLCTVQNQLIDMLSLSPGQSIVETACGTGLVTERIAEIVGAEGKVLATDLSQGMIDQLRQRLMLQGYSHARAERSTADRVDAPDGAFDAAVCALGLMYVPDPQAAITELARLTKMNGIIAATVWGERQNCGWSEIFNIIDSRVASKVCPLFFETGAKRALIRLFENAELHKIEERRQYEKLHYRSSKQMTEAILLGGPVALAAKRLNKSQWGDVEREFLISVAQYRLKDGSYQIPAEFVTVKAVRK